MSTTILSNYQSTPIRFDTSTVATGRIKLLLRRGSSQSFEQLNIIMPMLTALLSAGSDVNVHKSLDLAIIMSVHGASVSLLTIRGVAPLTSKVLGDLTVQTDVKKGGNTVLNLQQLFNSCIMHKTDTEGVAPTFKIRLGNSTDTYFIGYLIDIHCSTSLISPQLLNYLLKFLGLMKSRK